MRTYPELERRRVKKHGFYWPPHPLQVCTYLVLALQLLVTFVCMAPLFPKPLSVLLTQIYFMVVCGMLQVGVAVIGYMTTRSDPTDPAVYAHRRAMALR